MYLLHALLAHHPGRVFNLRCAARSGSRAARVVRKGSELMPLCENHYKQRMSALGGQRMSCST